MKMKKWVMMSMAFLTLAGCQNQSDQPEKSTTPESNETTEPAVEREEKQTSKPALVDLTGEEVEVTTHITKAVELVEGGVVSVINLKKADPVQLPFPYNAFSKSTKPSDELLQSGTGSGGIYKIDGDRAYIFTNNHVVEGSDQIEVLFQNGERVEAELVGADLYTDLAVLSVDAEHVDTVLKFGNSENLKVGEPAIAIGSPLGTEFASSVTAGIISGLGRTVPVDTDGDRRNDWEMNVLQTDAAINPGNSGGPLINIAGQVIGINSMKVNRDIVEGMGFAIPINDAAAVIEELEENGKVTRPVMGVSMVELQYLSNEQKAALGLPEDFTKGVVVYEVIPGSAAADAGLTQWDIITSFGGESVSGANQLRQMIYTSKIGEEIQIEFYRNGEKQQTTIRMQEGF